MATELEIYEKVNGEVIDDVSLNATSESKVAEFRKLIYTVTSISSILQGLWEIMKRQLIAAADSVPTCNASWWDSEIRKFQYGDALLLNDTTKKYYYEELDTDAQIVTRVAIVDQSGRGIIKVAKNGPVALTTDERNALSSYIKKIQPLGSNISVISQAADVIKLPLTVYYDPIIPQATVQTAVELAVNTYLSSLDFNVGKTGTYYTTYLIDAIQEVEGVVDVKAGDIQASQDGGTLVSVARKYVPVAGYLTVHPDHALGDTITYTAEI